ncbi:MAG TPA: TolC family protein, partial [Rubrivivax sp.]|nr:TolC family protein [Rubrivivax sp.]
GAGGSQGTTRSGSYSVGLTVNVPLLSAGIEPASNAARKRAQAAQLQRADAVETRRFRVAEVHEQAQAALDRAQRVVEVLRNSEQVRNFTLQQWQQLGRRSLFDVMAAESDHFNLRVAYVNALHDVQQLNAQILSLGLGVSEWLK